MENNHMSIDENIKKQIHEDIVGEIFRQIIIKEGVALDYVLLHEDDFQFEEDGNAISGAVHIFKDDNGLWTVWEVDYEYGAYYNVANFNNQIEAYIEAASRRGLNLELEDFNYDINDTDNMLNIVGSAEDFLLAGIEFYDKFYEGHSEKLKERYLLLASLEKQLLNNKDNKLSRKRMI